MNGILDSHLQLIEDHVLVEDKIVTYKWVSKALKVHINTAKQILHAFTLKEEFNKKLLVTYLIAGEGKDDSGLKFFLVKKEDVSKLNKSLDKVVCHHVYSVQRDSNFDAKNLYNADYNYEINEEDKKFCSIQKNENIVKKCKLGENGNVSTESKNIINSKLTVNKAPFVDSENNATTSKSSPESKLKIVKPLEEDSVEAKRNISPKNESTKGSPNKTGTLKNRKLKNAPTKGPSIGTLFNKQAAIAAIKKKEVSNLPVEEVKEESKENVGEVVNQALGNRKTQSDEAKHTPLTNKKKSTKKRKKNNREGESPRKRRKRIVIASDSESSDSEMDVEDERELSPEPGTVPVTQESDEDIIPPTPIEKGRKRIRKEVDRILAVEDGFIETHKVYINESCTDDEASVENLKEEKLVEVNATNDKTNSVVDENKLETNKKKQTKKNSPKKKTPSKNKQQSIMNFFKRK